MNHVPAFGIKLDFSNEGYLFGSLFISFNGNRHRRVHPCLSQDFEQGFSFALKKLRINIFFRHFMKF